VHRDALLFLLGLGVYGASAYRTFECASPYSYGSAVVFGLGTLLVGGTIAIALGGDMFYVQ
jgi:hypothetical protein